MCACTHVACTRAHACTRVCMQLACTEQAVKISLQGEAQLRDKNQACGSTCNNTYLHVGVDGACVEHESPVWRFRSKKISCRGTLVRVSRHIIPIHENHGLALIKHVGSRPHTLAALSTGHGCRVRCLRRIPCFCENELPWLVRITSQPQTVCAPLVVLVDHFFELLHSHYTPAMLLAT